MDWWKSVLAALAEGTAAFWKGLAADRGRRDMIRDLDAYEKDVLKLFAARNVQRLRVSDGVVAGLIHKGSLEEVTWSPDEWRDVMLAGWARQKLAREAFFRAED